MAPKIDLISDISPSKENWNIRVRVVRLWFVRDMKKDQLPYSLEMVLMDNKGDRINASVRRTLIYKYEKELREDRVFSIGNFSVASNVGSYRTARHPYKINFQYGTKIKQCDDKFVPADIYVIGDSREIFQSEYDTDYLIDVMGMLKAVGVEKSYTRNGSQSKMIPIELDYDGFRFKVTLFGPYVDELNAFLASGETENVVVAVLLTKIKIFQGQATIQNTINATKVLFNPTFTAALLLKKRMVENDDSPSPGISKITEASKVSVEEDFLNLSPMTTVEGLKDCAEEKCFAVFGTVNVIVDDSDWWYTSCVVCNKKVYPDEKMYFCSKCNKHVLNVTPRYMIKMRVVDHTDSATFVLFDRDAAELFKKTCADMIESCGMGTDASEVPKDILAMVEKSYLFKVETNLGSSTMYEKSYRVKRVTADPVLVEKFQTKYKDLMKNVHEEDVNLVDGVVDGGALKSSDTIVQDLMKKLDEPTAGSVDGIDESLTASVHGIGLVQDVAVMSDGGDVDAPDKRNVTVSKRPIDGSKVEKDGSSKSLELIKRIKTEKP
ncbi:replication protein A 70 kDa DNA-binding subunit B [Medicago truncatula]|uniref:Replication factor-A carboxy-terminal domain protein n=1 Tax=Medicago truncatula TaxID=3880 RepID=G7IGJ6_MEDTR|nr:replication protein A 70 kDa DNA-binding subunit B [Medicago truncatula]AES65761.1 replication factor-A carboxy-terminal domain protein [Medicago truncatula]